MLIGSHPAPPVRPIAGSTGTSTAPVNYQADESIDANITEDPVRYIVELPEKSATTQEWLESIRLEDAGRALVTGVAAAVTDEQTH